MTTAIVLMFFIVMLFGYAIDKLTDNVKAITDKIYGIHKKLDSMENSLFQIYLNTKQSKI